MVLFLFGMDVFWMTKKNSQNKLNQISTYALYSEEQSLGDPEFIHIEDIRVRAELFDWNINIHVHPKMFQVIYVKTGSVRIHIDGLEQEEQAPCLITVPSNVVHGFNFSEESASGSVVTVAQLLFADEEFQRKFPFYEELMRSAHILTLTQDDEDRPFIEQQLEEMAREYSAQYVGKTSMFEWLLFALLLRIGRKLQSHFEPHETGSRYEQRYQTLCELIEKHYREHLPATQYAEMLHTSLMGLNRACSAVSGKSVGELLQDRLILEAQRFLIYTAAPASLIAYDLGFKDPAYFSRFFKRRVGLSPGAFRNQRDT